jgi:alkylation response protein AidB-like acyl-CoA dehydrogenase
MTQDLASPATLLVASPESQHLVEAVAALRPTIRGYQAAIERERRLPLPLVEQLQDAGLYRLLVPRALGGAELDLVTVVRVLEFAAEGDGAVGWNLCTSAALSSAALSLPDDGVAELFADGPDVRFSGTTGPIGGQAEPVPGGYRVTGRWRFGSGCQEAQWFGAGCQVVVDGIAQQRADGSPDFRRVFFPAADCTVIDTWHVTGLGGTGSHDWAVHEVFVPERRTQRFGVDWRKWAGTLYTLAPYPAMAGTTFSAVATGIARTAIDALVDLAGSKKPLTATGLLRENPLTQDAVGRAEALLGAAQAYRSAVVGDVWATAARGQAVTRDQYARMRLAASYATDSAMQAVDLMYRAGGTTVIQREDGIGRCWRDIHIIGQNFNVDPEYYLLAGRAFLGLDPGPKLRIQ